MNPDAAHRLGVLAEYLGPAPGRERVARALGIVEADDDLGPLLRAAAYGENARAAYDAMNAALPAKTPNTLGLLDVIFAIRCREIERRGAPSFARPTSHGDRAVSVSPTAAGRRVLR